MKGLILKDLMVLKKTGRIFGLLLIMYVAMAVFTHADFGLLVAFITGMLSITSFAYDEQAKWTAYALTMPLTKKQMVNAKYLLALLLGIVGTVIGLLLSLFSNIGQGPVDMLSILARSGLALCAIYIFSSIGIPLFYKLGAEKSRIVLMMLYTIPIIAISALAEWLQTSFPAMPHLLSSVHTAALLLPLFTAAVMAISYRFSLSILNKKDI